MSSCKNNLVIQHHKFKINMGIFKQKMRNQLIKLILLIMIKFMKIMKKLKKILTHKILIGIEV